MTQKNDAPAPVSDELWAARLLHQAKRPQPLSPAELAVIGARLPRPSITRAPHWFWRVATAVFLLLCGGALMAGTLRLLRPTPATLPAKQAPVVPKPPRARVAARPGLPQVPPVEVPPVDEAAAAKAPAAASRPTRNVAPAIEIAPPPAPPPSTPAPSALREETALVASALHRLREGNDAAGALALLDEHDRRFGTAGLLGDEVSATRIEAWLRTDQHARALSVLDGRVLRPAGAARALLAARADLRAEAGRCAEARADFDLLLAGGGVDDAIEERALFGRASCLSREGDAAAARVELEQYLSRFPAGAFAARARAALAR
jgi:hypothetical protein